MKIKQKTSDVIIACSLDSLELVKRKMELQQYIFSQAEKVTELEDSVRFVFKTSSDFSSRLIEFINSERDCCPFFGFKIEFMPHHGAIILEIRGPEEAKEMLKYLIK